MRLKHELRHLIQRLGVDVVRYPLHDPLARTVKLLGAAEVDCVIDVGANDGGFATAIRRLGYTGSIFSFEPLRGPYEALHARASADEKWEAINCAVGGHGGEVTINVSGNDGLSSSILPMLEKHASIAPTSRYVGKQTIMQEQLDVLVPQLRIDTHNRTFLKVDVQGYEKEVLQGAQKLLEEGKIVGLQLELSLVPLYEGAMPYREALDRAADLGMTLMGLDPVFADPASGQLLQADAVFFAT